MCCAATSAKCEWPWEDDYHSDWCYQFHLDWRVTFSGGVTSCRALGGELASISSPADRNFIFGALPARLRPSRAFTRQVRA